MFFSVFSLIPWGFYKNGSGYSGENKKYTTGMLGNLGYSAVHCKITPASLSFVDVSCDYGTIGSITHLGISNPGLDGTNAYDICVVNEFNQRCAPDSAFVN